MTNDGSIGGSGMNKETRTDVRKINCLHNHIGVLRILSYPSMDISYRCVECEENAQTLSKKKPRGNYDVKIACSVAPIFKVKPMVVRNGVIK